MAQASIVSTMTSLYTNMLCFKRGVACCYSYNSPMFHISLSASEEVVNDSHFVSVSHQLVHKMRANKTRTTCYLLRQSKRKVSR